MAMIKCPECRHEISNKALSCPFCGNPINMRQEIPVEFIRESAFSGAGIKFLLFVDGMFVGKLKNGESFKTSIMQGNHQLDIKVANPLGIVTNRTVISFNVPDDANELYVKVVMGLTGPTIKDIIAV